MTIIVPDSFPHRHKDSEILEGSAETKIDHGLFCFLDMFSIHIVMIKLYNKCFARGFVHV
jgi:hypothetical protein